LGTPTSGALLTPVSTKPGQSHSHAATRWLTTTTAVHGFPLLIVNTRPELETDALVTRLDTALQLIAQYQPRRYRKLRQTIARFVVRRYPCRGAFFPDTGTCLIELTFLGNLQMHESQIAACVIHEATHARLARVGRVVSGPAAERICRNAELQFGRALPEGQRVIARAEESLALPDDGVAPDIDWHFASRRVAAVDLAAGPLPTWLKRLIAKRKKLRLSDVGLDDPGA
jgi:hypothetical protein